MGIRRFRKQLRRFTKWLRRPSVRAWCAGIVVCIAVALYAGYMSNRQLRVDPATCQPLLQLIGKAESNDNYNAYFGNPSNSTVVFTDMTVAEVLAWQRAFVQQGNPSSAVGRYQIIDRTLEELVRSLRINPAQKFTPAMQDRLAIALLERRGAVGYVNQRLSAEQFAASLAKEWAALPKTTGSNPEASYYAGDGLNASRVSVAEVLRAIGPIGPQQT